MTGRANSRCRFELRSAPIARLAHAAASVTKLFRGYAALGAFSVSQPAIDQFPFQIWSRLVMRHCSQSPCERSSIRRTFGALSRCAKRFATYLTNGSCGPLRFASGHDRGRVPAGSRDFHSSASGRRESCLDRRARILAYATCFERGGRRAWCPCRSTMKGWT